MTSESKVEDIEKQIPTLQNQSNTEPYSCYTVWQKRGLIFAAALAAFFSPLSASVYIPALTTLATAENVSNTLINLTITSYLIFQGLAPTFVGGFSDTSGRRPAYLICFVIYIAANLGLALQNNYAALLVLRMVQSAGSSATVALSSAVAADLVTSAERGSYIGYTTVTVILAPTIAPIIGGVLSEYAGWRWIFWFLLISSSVFFIPFLIFFPETCRKVVGNGSIPPPTLYHSVPTYLRERRLKREGEIHLFEERDRLSKKRKPSFPNPLVVLLIVFNKQASILLLSSGLLFSCWYVMISSLPSQMEARYGFNDAQIGLLFIPLGIGSAISSVTSGKLIDWNYRRHARRLGITVQRDRQDDISKFPIERARLEIGLPMLYFGVAMVIAYGWVLQYNTGIAPICVVMFVFGWAMIAVFNTLTILMVDLYPGKAASATAATNLVRCWLGAGASAVVIPLINAIGVGWACTLAAFLWLVFSPLVFLLIKFGPRWRAEAAEKKRASEKNKGQSEAEVAQETGNLVVAVESKDIKQENTEKELDGLQSNAEHADKIAEIGQME